MVEIVVWPFCSPPLFQMKSNPILNSFFGQMTYSSFQKLVDAYVEKRVTPVTNPPTVPPTAPELVKLAFTLDFTARIAGLSKQNVGHITCLGKNYLQHRFEYKQVRGNIGAAFQGRQLKHFKTDLKNDMQVFSWICQIWSVWHGYDSSSRHVRIIRGLTASKRRRLRETFKPMMDQRQQLPTSST